MSTYTRNVAVTFNDTDAAGILYFASQLIYAHETFEAFLAEVGYSLHEILQSGEYLLPLVHVEADYLSSTTVGDELTVEMSVARLGTSSFTMAYTLRDADGNEVGRCQTVHVAVDRTTRTTMAIPDELKNRLTSIGDITS